MTVDIINSQKLVTDLAQRAIDRVIELGEKKIREYWAKWRNRDATFYGEYLTRKGINLSNIKNIIYVNRTASLYDIYVPNYVLPRDRSVNDYIKSLCSSVANLDSRPTRALAIVGTAGAGKSLLMRHAFFQILRGDFRRIPIFLEMRTFNRTEKADLETRIYDDFRSLGIKLLPEQITAGLESGLFVLLLDGVDELSQRIQNHYLEQISDVVKKYPNCPLLVSGRPSQRLSSLPVEEVSRIARMTQDEACDLIQRLDFDAAKKEQFLLLLGTTLYSSHSDFASNPLLCTIMLLTYSSSGQISNKRHEFYEDAFQALWSLHDVRKEDGTIREKYSNLQKRDFERILAAFSMSSYLRGDYDLRDSDVRRHFGQAVKLQTTTCKEEDFVKDLTISTCLAIEEGPTIRFVHRSFQEYFAALFLSEANDDVATRLIDELSERIETDKVIQLALSLNLDRIERSWSCPKLVEISSFIENTTNDIERYANAACGESAASTSIQRILRTIRILYEFKPDQSTLLAAYDAAKHMGVRVTKMSGGSKRLKVFEADMKNFSELALKLNSKYSNQATAFEVLLGKLEHRL